MTSKSPATIMKQSQCRMEKTLQNIPTPCSNMSRTVLRSRETKGCVAVQCSTDSP